MTLDATRLDALELCIAAASRNDEARLFDEAMALAQIDPEIARLRANCAFADAAIRIHRALLPAHGYHLGETAARKGLASTWRRGEAQTLPFEAATPGLALLRATAHATARHIQRETRAACGICGGLGWTITRKGGKRICRHGSLA
jgi:hypothetical protein